MRDRIFYSACFGFVFGVLLRSLLWANIYFAILLGVVSVALFLFFLLVSQNNWGIMATIFVFTFSLGILRFHAADVLPFHVYEQSIGEEISGEAEIIDEPDIRENNQKLIVEEDISGIKTKILITTGLEDHFKYGDKISFFGKIEKPENFITDQGKEFDYINYLRKDEIYYIMNYAGIEIISSENGNKVKNILFLVKEKFLEKMNLAIASPENLLMGGLILGEKAAFSQELRQIFVDTGTIHIVALSGYNITIVAEWFVKLFSFLPYVSQNLGIGMGIFAILLLILMTGAR